VGPRTDLDVRGKFRPHRDSIPDVDGPGIESLYRLSYTDPQEEKTHSNLACLKMRHRHKAQPEYPKRKDHLERKGIRRKITKIVFKET
jgi:hypothetical protein